MGVSEICERIVGVEMTGLQRKLLDMLGWFDNYCRKHELSYYAVGGTLLGAVRHKGFIPWDDDIDIAMPRKDFEKLALLMGDSIIDNYLLETYKSDNEDYCYPYNKLYDVTTTLIENYRIPLKRGIFLDIFPLDGTGNTEQDSVKWCKKINRKYYFYLTRMASVNKNRKIYKNMAIHIARMIPNMFIDNREYRIKLSEECKNFDMKESLFSANILGNWGVKEIVPTSVIGTPTEYQFEDTFIYGVEDYDSYLTHIYGDWRKLPPVEKRVSHHDYLCLDLNKSYM